jgi:protein-S-isoprenylcysteine O-methyltransferase Ste14
MKKREIDAGSLFGIILLVGIGVDVVLSLWSGRGTSRIALLQANRAVSFVSVSVGAVLLIAGCIVGYVSHEAVNRAVSEDRQVGYIMKDGLYGVVRHPFYLSLILIILSLVGLLRSYALLLGWVVMTVLLVGEARREERELVEEFGEEYTDYQRRTGMFLPKVGGR